MSIYTKPVSELTPEQRWRLKNPDYYRNNREHLNSAERQRYKKQGKQNNSIKAKSQYLQRRQDRPWLQLKINAARRAREKNIEFTLTAEYIESIWTNTCPILGIPLFHSSVKGKACDNSHSIDRIDSSKGYVPGNVAIISYKANVIKNNGTANEHRLIAEWMEKSSSYSKSHEPTISNLSD